MKKLIVMIVAVFVVTEVAAHHFYSKFPITLKGYTGDKTNSVSYSGQIARHVLHDSLKKLAGKGDGGSNAAEIEAQMMKYFKGSKEDLDIIAPKTKGDFKIKQTTLNQISKGKNLSGKTYKGVINGWPGQMTGPEVIEFMIKKAAQTKGGFDPATGYNYPQLISKFAMGAVFYNQAVDNYLDEKMAPGSKTNDKPYKDGAYYTYKEHAWDEAFGSWGAVSHGLGLSAKQNYDITKMKDMAAADQNKDGVVDLKSEYNFAHAYYASSFDKGGKTNYYNTVTQAFLDGRKIIAGAKGEKLSSSEKSALQGHIAVINANWEKVIAESVFKYAGSVYKDIVKLEENYSDKAFSTYAKHWGELKGFALALQTGKSNLGETAVKLNRLTGMGPVLMNASQVTGVDSAGNYIKEEAQSWGEFKLHMLKIQKLMVEKFGVKAKGNDMLADMSSLASKVGSSDSAEND